jgi:hypothetical protein
MAEAFTPALRALVVAALLLATTALMLAVVSTAQAAGALAVASCDAFGEAFDFASVAGARQNALAKCQAENCRVVTTVRRGCTAFAVHLTIFVGRTAGARRPSSAAARTRRCAPAIATAARNA